MNINFDLSRQRRKGAGFTLIEMVLVLAIVALLVGAGIVHLTGVLDEGKYQRVKADISAVTSALRTYEMSSLSVPTTAQGLQALTAQPTTQPLPKRWRQYLPKQLQDPWGRDYQYRSPGTKNSAGFDVYSFGPHGVESPDDIGNWED